MPAGMQLGIMKLLTTTGPLPVPSWGSISSMTPMFVMGIEFPLACRKCPVLGFQTDPPNPAGEISPSQPLAGAVWLQNAPVV